MRIHFLFVVTSLLLSCDARDFWRGKAGEKEEIGEALLMGCKDSRQCPNPNDPGGKGPAQIVCNILANGGNGKCQPCDMFTEERCVEKSDPMQSVCVRVGVNKGFCKQCVLSESCGSDQVCDSDQNICRGCRADSECSSRICQDAKCVPTTDPLYVDRAQPYCDMGMDGTGMKDRPYCQIQTAVMNRGTKTLIVVSPSPAMKDYQLVTVSSGTFTIRGPWADPGLAGKDWDTTTTATINRVRIDGTADVIFDGITMTSSVDQPAAYCTGLMATASLTLRRVLTEGGYQGVRADTCKSIVIERSQVKAGAMGGIRISFDTVRYRIVNSLITGNIGGPGVELGTGSQGVFEFNTIRQNSGILDMNGGGIICDLGGAAKTIANTIVVGNTTAMNGTQIVGNDVCMLSNVVVGTTDSTSMPGAIKQQPDFVVGANKLKATNPCCVDKVEKVATSPTEDYYGNPRPAIGRTKLTLGFHEP